MAGSKIFGSRSIPEVVPGRRRLRVPVLVCLLAIAVATKAASLDDRAGIQAFNQRLESATLAMDNAATLALWAEDGVSLLPSTKPLAGKPAIAAFLKSVTEGLPGAKMRSFEMECSDVAISGGLATEWCTEHQVVDLPGGKPPFDGRGKMLFVLRRGSGGEWLILREMWNQTEAK